MAVEDVFIIAGREEVVVMEEAAAAAAAAKLYRWGQVYKAVLVRTAVLSRAVNTNDYTQRTFPTTICSRIEFRFSNGEPFFDNNKNPLPTRTNTRPEMWAKTTFWFAALALIAVSSVAAVPLTTIDADAPGKRLGILF